MCINVYEVHIDVYQVYQLNIDVYQLNETKMTQFWSLDVLIVFPLV